MSLDKIYLMGKYAQTHSGGKITMTDLSTILAECCHQFRKGDQIVQRQAGNLAVTEVFAMPHVDEAAPDLMLVDCHFMVIGVDLISAELHRDDLIRILDPLAALLKRGPSYMAIAAELMIEQDHAFMLMAVGSALGFWRVVTPEILRLDGEMADRAASAGYIMITGYRREGRGEEAA